MIITDSSPRPSGEVLCINTAPEPCLINHNNKIYQVLSKQHANYKNIQHTKPTSIIP